MHLNTIINHWPAEQTYNSQWVRATRAARKALGRQDITAKTEVTEEEMRLIIRAIPERAEGVEEAYIFLALHEGFPAQEWVRMCDKYSPKTKGVLEEKVEALQRQIQALEKENEDLKKRLDQIAP